MIEPMPGMQVTIRAEIDALDGEVASFAIPGLYDDEPPTTASISRTRWEEAGRPHFLLVGIPSNST